MEWIALLIAAGMMLLGARKASWWWPVGVLIGLPALITLQNLATRGDLYRDNMWVPGVLVLAIPLFVAVTLVPFALGRLTRWIVGKLRPAAPPPEQAG